VSEAEVSIQDVYRKWIHCKHKNYMTIIELTNEGWWYPLITSTSIANPWYNIINENRVKHQSLLSREIGSWSRSIITIPSWRYSFLHMAIS